MTALGPRWLQNAATVFGAAAWLSLGALWVVVPQGMVVCLVAAAASASIAAFCSVLLRSPIWYILGYGLLAALGLNLIVVEIAFGWAFVSPLYVVVLAYGHVAALWLAAMLVLSNWPELPPLVVAGLVVLLAVVIGLLELTLRSSGALGFLLAGLVLTATVTAAVATVRRRATQAVPWWSVPLGLVVVAVSTWLSTAVLLGEAGQDPALRIDAIKTGLLSGVIAAGGFILLLAVRWQWLKNPTSDREDRTA